MLHACLAHSLIHNHFGGGRQLLQVDKSALYEACWHSGGRTYAESLRGHDMLMTQGTIVPGVRLGFSQEIGRPLASVGRPATVQLCRR